jgi:hypothetical protein
MPCNIGIVAHVARFEQARQLFKDVGADYISMDFGSMDARGNHLAVWGQLASMDAAWSLVLEDDADVSHLTHSTFRDQVDLVLDAAPTTVVSLYLGTGNPKHWQPKIKRSLKLAQARNADWLVCHSLLHAVAVAVPTAQVPDMLAYLNRRSGPIDEDITRWAVKRHGPQAVSYTVPSLVDHDDTSTLMVHADRHARNRERKAWLKGARSQWNTDTVRLAM